MDDNLDYDVVIIGGGPAGLTAGLYAARGKLNSLLIEKAVIGGQITNAGLIENFPGFPEGIDGFELGQLMQQQAEKYGLKIISAEVTGIELKEDSQKVVKTTEGDFETKAVIIAGAASRQKLGVPGEEEFTGRGVSYCATCDGPLFQDRAVAVAGGGNAAITEALHLAKFASRVIVIHRRDQLRATAILQERAFAEPKIEFLWDTTIEKIEGENFVKRLRLKQVKTGEKSTLEVAGVFVSIGFKPDTDYIKNVVPLDIVGHVITNEKMETEIPGVFAAGDIRHDSARQAVTAAGDGATAAIYAERFLTENK
ncbi:MAG: thioredoxin-disulfide reductase [Chloroflexi bacterium]|nr:thioredoxin-disulfide reductase [Chloroflexota bacterium]MBI3040413.1 thioredoxin-disulfide reductase [Chloroflexota bacterium]